MTSETETSSLPKFETRKEYMDYLMGMMVTAEDEEESEELFGETRGRPRLLKTYVMEANRGLPSNRESLDVLIQPVDTGLRDVTWITLATTAKTNPKSARFLVDMSDQRFWLLHTNALAEDARQLYDKLVYSPKATFDKIWLPKHMMHEIRDLPRNEFRGFGLDYVDFFELDQEERALEELTMRVSGSSSMVALNALSTEKRLKNSLATSVIRVKRGDKQDFVYDELAYDGRFSARGGSSIDAYTSLIEITTKKYRNLIESIERNSLGIKDVEGRTLIEGRAFDFNFDREILSIPQFLDVLLNCKQPFRIWGLKNKLVNNVYQVFGVDLHTGDSIDMEITPYLLRVYLPANSCGNTILRLFTNLQHYYDSKVRLNEEEEPEGE